MRLISCILIFYAFIDDCNTQFDFSQFFNQQPPQQPNFAYQNIPHNNYYGNNQQMSPYLMNNYNYRLQCECSCDHCHIPKQCCNEFCTKCALANNPALYLYPYPYIFVDPQTTMQQPTTTVTQTATQATTTTETTSTETTSTETTSTETTSTQTILTETTTATHATTTTQATTTTHAPTSTTTTSQPSIIRRSGNALPEDFIKKLLYSSSEMKQDTGNIIMTALRRTKPRWMPKYGIVPIPDQLAEKLMLRMRQVKVLHPEIDTMRRTDPL